MSMPKFMSGFRLPWGNDLQTMATAIDNLQGNGTAGAVSASTLTATTAAVTNVSQAGATGTTTVGYQSVTAAGATQGNATLITGTKAIITVSATASTHGVKLPVAVTGMEVTIANAGAFGAKIYPNTNGKLGASSTNSAIVLAINKINKYVALNTTRWVLQVGG